MEATALCIGLLMNVLMLRLTCTQESDAAAALIVPSRLQLFEYESISFDCEGPNATAGWRVLRKVKGKVGVCVSTWETTTASVCAIKPAYSTDSGEYWCEAGEERSNAVNISITAGSVILESPARPVMETDSVTLRCRSRMTSSAHMADFYKDGLRLGSGSTGEMTIQAVSKSDEGLYKCSISDFGESPESWLAVSWFRAPPTETLPPPEDSCHIYILLRTVSTVVLVPLLLLLVGLLHCGKLRVTQRYVCICKICQGSCQTAEQNKKVEGDEKEE